MSEDNPSPSSLSLMSFPPTHTNPFYLFQESPCTSAHTPNQIYPSHWYSFRPRFPTMANQNADEMEEMQRLSDRYQPSLEGPLVGDKLPISSLVTEYAQADPRFVAKTHALATRYMAYRRIKGDGQCGWRGTVFGYFEAILKTKDHGFALQEYTRIKSFEDTMNMAGINYNLLEDFFEETWTLFQSIIQSFEQNQINDTIVTSVFNDENRSNAIVYHFKMLTSAFMALHPEDFEPFLEMSLDQYRQTRIDPALQEIDQIGLQALTTGVIAPANLAVEVLYLDRSAGDEVTPHEFVPNAADRPAIRLLYRPGHYDLIYKQDEPYTVLIANNVPNADAFDTVQSYMDDAMYLNLFPSSSFMDDRLATMPQVSSTTSYSYQPDPYMQPSLQDDSAMYVPAQYNVPFPQRAVPMPADFSQRPSRTSSHCQSSPEAYSNPTSPPPPPTMLPPSAIQPQTPFSTSPFTNDNGPLIRHSEYSSVMRGRRRVHHPSMPLDSSQWGTSSQDPAHFSNKNFTPVMYRQ